MKNYSEENKNDLYNILLGSLLSKDDGIDAYITCDMSSEESVTVFVDGDEVMSA